MTLQLLLDECAYKAALHRQLLDAGFAVTTAAEAGLLGDDDDVVFAYAVAHGLCIVTKNPDDFRALHQAHPDHPGIFLIYQDNDVTRDMTDAEVVRALQNVAAADVPIAGEIHALNHWRY